MNKIDGDLIRKLRIEGKSYQEIKSVTGASLATIAYHTNPNYRKRIIKHASPYKIKRRNDYKLERGGKCKLCGYSKCLDALHFHHLENKEHEMSKLFTNGPIHLIEQEMKKCVLVCANCHSEIHAGAATISH